MDWHSLRCEYRGRGTTTLDDGLLAGPFLKVRCLCRRLTTTLELALREALVVLEDWLNDGIPLAAEVARECLFGWYGENRPANVTWEVSGQIIDPARIDCPTLGIIPSQDRIVPPASAQALLDIIPSTTSLSPKAGHIGMMTGRHAVTQLWKPVTDWIKSF